MPEEEFAEEGVPYSGGQGSLRDKEDQSFILELLDPSKTLERLEHYLRGQVWTASDHKWVKKFPAKMNEVGINWVMPYLWAHLDPVFKTTTFKKEEINAVMEEITCTLVNTFTSEAANFGIGATYSEFRALLDIVEHLIYATLQSSLQNLGRRMITDTTHRNENVDIDAKEGGGEGLPGLNIFSRRK